MKKRKWVAIFLVLACISNSFSSIAAENNVSDIALGNYQESMIVGEVQNLNPTLVPDGIEGDISYSSSDEKIATIDETGKITALQKGTATISVKCQEIEKSFLLTVEEAEIEKIAVKDIEIGEYEETVEVGKTVELSVTVLPTEAADTAVTYQSDNPPVATVNSTGVVKGIAPGNAIITVTAGEVVKQIPLTIKVATTSIQPNNTYVVLKRGQSYQLSAQVTPAQANQNIIYRSSNSGIASVTESGMIFANALGSTTIIVSNGDMSSAVTVIVNTGTVITGGTKQNKKEALEETQIQNEEQLVKEIMEEKALKISVEEYPIIKKSILEALYENQKSLQIEAEDYILELYGKDILNYQNELSTEIVLKKDKKGIVFKINNGRNLPGTVYLQIKNIKSYKYVYLYNSAKKKYEQIKIDDVKKIKLDTTGKYLLTKDEIKSCSFNKILVIGTGIVVAGMAVIYILWKKKYWFW